MSAIRLAEAATLGGLLVDPRAVPVVTSWLRPGDFTDPWNSQLFTLLCERHAAGLAVAPEEVGLALLDRVGPRRADLVRIVGLLSAAPPDCYPLQYARMVLEASLRRDVGGLGVLIRASALAASPASLEGGLALVADRLREGEGRWQRASGGSPSPSTTHPEPAPAFSALDRHLAADRFLATHPAPDPVSVAENERRLVAALICHPREISAVEAWLHPEMLTDLQWAAAYRAVLELAGRSQEIDVVTVAWQIGRAAQQNGPGPGVSDLLQAADLAVADSPTYYGRHVARDVLHRTAEYASNSLQAAAGNPGLDLVEVFETASLLTQGVRTAAIAFGGERQDLVPRRLSAVPALRVTAAANDGIRPAAL